jgi:hypothetical protein
MRNLITSTLLGLLASSASAQCTGYPCDTLWYDENGRLNDLFVVKEVRFILGKCDIGTYGTTIGDSSFIAKMYANLDSLAAALILDGGIFEIQVHTDCRGNTSVQSWKPTECRAKSLCDYLVARGVSAEKLVPKGYGENLPRQIVEGERTTLLTCTHINSFKVANKDIYELLHQLNRRIVVKRLN